MLVASILFGSSAIFIRFATQANAVSLTFFRLFIATFLMLLFALSKHELRFLNRRDLLLVTLSGLFLSFHFATFILAVKETTVANATFLVNTSPVMLAVLSPLVIKERTTKQEVLAVSVASVGILLVAHAGNGFQTFGVGDVSALLAAFFVAIYSMLGRRLRTCGMTTACYTTYVYGAATVASLAMIGFLNVQTFQLYDTWNIVAILGLGIVPTALGHTLYNYALGSVKTVTANLFPLMEPVAASVFAFILFSEAPGVIQVAGYFLILLAVVTVGLPSSFVRHRGIN